MTLTEKQTEGLSKLKKFIQAPLYKNKYMLIKGYAGTGKSTLINEFINWYNSSKKIVLDDLVVTAPTNKAVRVLRRMAGDNGVEYKTLHSLLGLRPVIDNNGKEVFVKDTQSNPNIYLYGCVIVDESSMIDNEIFEELINEAIDCKIIFVGDDCQIPPVNHFHSKPMIPEVQEDLGIDTFHLTDIIRQAADNPIIKTSLDIRKGTFERKNSDDRDEWGIGVYQVDKTDKSEVDKLLREKFCSKEFKNNPDYAKVIAWTNNRVNTFNKYIRENLLYYKGVNKVMKDEKLIINRPIFEGKGKKARVKFFVNDDLMVTSVQVRQEEHYTKLLKYYECEVTRLYESDNKKSILKILHEESEIDFNNTLGLLKAEALTAHKKLKGKKWKTFYEYKDLYADVSYNYAITAHKSQGSTYNNAFVCYYDIIKNYKTAEMQRILYTAVTRPSETLFIL